MILYGLIVRYDWMRPRPDSSHPLIKLRLTLKTSQSTNGFLTFEHLLCTLSIARHNHAEVALATIVHSLVYLSPALLIYEASAGQPT